MKHGRVSSNRRMNPAALAVIASLYGCGESEDSLSAGQYESSSTAQGLEAQLDLSEQSPAQTAEAVNESPRNELHELVANVWALSDSNCGHEHHDVASPDEVMAAVPAARRAALIRQVLKEVPLSAGRVQRLLELLGTTTGPDAASGLTEAWEDAEYLVDRYHAALYEPEVAQSSGNAAFAVSEAFRANMISLVHLGVVRGASSHAQGVPLLTEALDAPSPTVRAEAIVALASRSDFADRRRLLEARKTLPENWPAVDQALARPL